MSLWEKLCSSKNKQSCPGPAPSQQIESQVSQNTVRDIFADMRFLLKDQQVKTIFDVGANRGDFTSEFVKAYPDAEIHCFEPNPTTCEVLKNRFEESPRINIQNSAVSNSNGTADFCCNKECATDSLLPPSSGWKEWVDGKSDALLLTSRIQVKTVTLDQFCHEHAIGEIDLLKIDTQGAELLVFEGLNGLLQKRAVHVIIAELLFVPVYAGQPYYYDVCSRLAEDGYNLVNLYDCRYDDENVRQLK